MFLYEDWIKKNPMKSEKQIESLRRFTPEGIAEKRGQITTYDIQESGKNEAWENRFDPNVHKLLKEAEEMRSKRNAP